jgi:hypothetical protein
MVFSSSFDKRQWTLPEQILETLLHGFHKESQDTYSVDGSKLLRLVGIDLADIVATFCPTTACTIFHFPADIASYPARQQPRFGVYMYVYINIDK